MSAVFLSHLEALFTWLIAASWQASVLALLVLGAQQAFGTRLNPRWRHTLWLLVILRLILPALPESALSLFQFAPSTPAALTQTIAEPLFTTEPLAPSPAIYTERPASLTPFTVYSLLSVLWLTGAFTLFVLTWSVNRRFARQVENSPTIRDPQILRRFAAAQTELGLHRAIRLIENSRVTSPAIMGFFRPTLLLPAAVAEKFDPVELRLIFLHELAHLKRGDVIVQALIAFLQILHWFNPVLWYAFRRLRIDREPATDALVLSRVGEAEKERYGLMLIKLLEHFNQRHSLPTLVGILEDKDQFKRRFQLIARFTRSAYGWSLLGVIILALLAVTGLTRAKAKSIEISPVNPQNVVTAISSAPGPIHQGMVRVATKIVQISDADYQAHQGEIDDAAQRGDIEPLSRLKSFNLISEPAILTKAGDQGVVETVRVFPYPVAFKKDENGKMVPTDYARKYIGVRFVQKPTFHDEKINITGALTISSLQGWKKIDDNISQPIFRDDGIPSVNVSFESGQTIALKSPYPAPLAKDPTAIFNPDTTTHPPSRELRHLFLFLNAVAYPQATNESPGPAAPDKPGPATTENPIVTPTTSEDRPPATQPINQTEPSYFNKSGYFGSSINAPFHVVMKLVEVDEKAYELNAAAMDNAVKNGDSQFFAERKDAYVAPDAALDLPTDKGWYSTGYVQSYIATVKYEKIEGTPHTTLQAVAVFNGINADFAVSALPENVSIDSTWSDVEPEAIHEQHFDPQFSPTNFPTTLDLTPKMHTAKFADKGWKIQFGVPHGFWVGETFGQFTRTLQFRDRSHASLEEMIKTRKPSRLAVFMTAQVADPALDPIVAAKGKSLTVRTFLVPAHFFPGADLVPASLFPDLTLPAAPTPAAITVQDILVKKGIRFTDGASARFLPDSNKLVVQNTPEQLDLVAHLIEQASLNNASSLPIPATTDPKDSAHTFLEVMSFAMPPHFDSIGFIDVKKPDEPALLEKLLPETPNATLASFSLKLNKNTYQGSTASGLDYEIVVDWNGSSTNPTQPIDVFLKWPDESWANSSGHSSGYRTTFSLDKDLFVVALANNKPIPALLIRLVNRPFKIAGNMELSGHTLNAPTALPAPAQLTYQLPRPQPVYENGGTQVLYDHTTYTNGQVVHNSTSPQQQYLAIYMATRPPRPDDLAHEQDTLAKLEALKAAYPTWEVQLMETRIAKTKVSIAALQANAPVSAPR